MYRMVIVDDKAVERRGLQKAIDWGDLGVQVVGTYANGRLALEAVDADPPDIVLSDIAMPVLNGIEMAREIHARHPDVRILFMSCHSDFEYARSAVELGIASYVLKPIDLDELKQAVGRVVQALSLAELRQRELQKAKEDSKASLALAREHFLKDLMLGNYASREEAAGHMNLVDLALPAGASLQVAALSLLRPRESADPPPAGYIVSYAVREIVARFSGADLVLLPVQISETRYAVLALAGGTAEAGSGKSAAPAASAAPGRRTLLPGLLDALAGIHDDMGRRTGLPVKLGVSRIAGDLLSLPSLYLETDAALGSVLYSESDPIILYEAVAGLERQPVLTGADLDLLYQDLRSVLSIGDDGELDQFLEDHFAAEGPPAPELAVRRLAYTLLNMAVLLLAESGKTLRDVFGDEADLWQRVARIETVTSMREWLASVFRPVRDALWGRPDSSRSRIVGSIREIIHQDYAEPLKVDDIARRVFLSTRYCNTLFKKETGLTVFDYLVDYRIRMAMKLLRNPDSKVTAVASEVGYDNPSYFCLLFKRHTGLTPAEYKMRNPA